MKVYVINICEYLGEEGIATTNVAVLNDEWEVRTLVEHLECLAKDSLFDTNVTVEEYELNKYALHDSLSDYMWGESEED